MLKRFKASPQISLAAFITLACALVLCGCASAPSNVPASTAHALVHPTPATSPSPAETPPLAPGAYVLHCPGIGGLMRIDRDLQAGLKEGGIDGKIEIYDWTGADRGLSSLSNVDRHKAESAKVAQKITDLYRADPARPIVITGHSAGTGIVVWALEQLPDDVQVYEVLLMQSALSPTYDLTAALRHVRSSLYAFSSEHDTIVLGTGTRMFGTVDRVKTDAAGRVGFTEPLNVDRTQYEKLVQIRYDPAWLQYGNDGDHIGPMNRRFAKNVLAPLLISGRLPQVPSTRPTRGVFPSTSPSQ